MNSSQVKALCDRAVAEYVKNTTLAEFTQEKRIQHRDELEAAKLAAICSHESDEEDTEERECEELEFEGNTYLKDEDENVYKYDLTNVEKIGVWNEQNERIVFDDDQRTMEERNADITDMLRKSLKGSPLVKNLAAELRKKGVSVEDLRGGRAVKA